MDEFALLSLGGFLEGAKLFKWVREHYKPGVPGTSLAEGFLKERWLIVYMCCSWSDWAVSRRDCCFRSSFL